MELKVTDGWLREIAAAAREGTFERTPLWRGLNELEQKFAQDIAQAVCGTALALLGDNKAGENRLRYGHVAAAKELVKLPALRWAGNSDFVKVLNAAWELAPLSAKQEESTPSFNFGHVVRVPISPMAPAPRSVLYPVCQPGEPMCCKLNSTGSMYCSRITGHASKHAAYLREGDPGEPIAVW